jgi:aldehyde:ferredoxin oxidoreductase
MFLANGRAGVIDLSSGEVSEQELDEELLLGRQSSLEAVEKLASEHGPDSLVLGTGVLTGSLIPGACAGVMRGPKGRAPLLGHAGVELKLSGFDFIVIKGVAPEPGYVWIRDGMIELVPAPAMKGMDSWGRTDMIRDQQGDRKIQVLSVGPWGDARSPIAQFVTDYWGGEDKAGLGAEFGRKNIVAVAFRGMGEFEVSDPDAHFDSCARLRDRHIAKLGRSDGLASFSRAAAREDFRAIVHRDIACFGCPFPCRSFVKVNEDPWVMTLSSKEPGYLHYDILALEKAHSLWISAKDATQLMVKCAKAGVEPCSLMSSGHREGFDGLLASPKDIEPSSEDSSGLSWWSAMSDRRKNEACLGLGLCPRYWAKAGFELGPLDPCVQSALGRGIRTDW